MHASTHDLDLAFQVLEESQRETFPYTIVQCGRPFIVLENVFSPKHLPGCELFAEKLPISPGITVLEIGAGTGVIAVMAALRGARRVVATDINPAAVENIRRNASEHGLDDIVDVRCGSIYEPLEANERFDLMFWNIPFLLVDTATPLSLLQRSVADPGYESAREFLVGGRKHLTSQGRLLFGFSSTVGNLDALGELARGNGIDLELFHRESNYVSQSAMDMEIFEVHYRQ